MAADRVALDDDAGHARLGEVVGGGHAHDAAAHDHYIATGHLGRVLSLIWRSPPGPLDLPGDHLAVHAVEPDGLTGCRSPPAGDQNLEAVRTDDGGNHRVVVGRVRDLRPVGLVGRRQPPRTLDVTHGANTAVH